MICASGQHFVLNNYFCIRHNLSSVHKTLINKDSLPSTTCHSGSKTCHSKWMHPPLWALTSYCTFNCQSECFQTAMGKRSERVLPNHCVRRGRNEVAQNNLTRFMRPPCFFIISSSTMPCKHILMRMACKTQSQLIVTALVNHCFCTKISHQCSACVHWWTEMGRQGRGRNRGSKATTEQKRLPDHWWWWSTWACPLPRGTQTTAPADPDPPRSLYRRSTHRYQTASTTRNLLTSRIAPKRSPVHCTRERILTQRVFFWDVARMMSLVKRCPFGWRDIFFHLRRMWFASSASGSLWRPPPSPRSENTKTNYSTRTTAPGEYQRSEGASLNNIVGLYVECVGDVQQNEDVWSSTWKFSVDLNRWTHKWGKTEQLANCSCSYQILRLFHWRSFRMYNTNAAVPFMFATRVQLEVCPFVSILFTEKRQTRTSNCQKNPFELMLYEQSKEQRSLDRTFIQQFW